MSKKILVFGDSNTFGTPPMVERDGNSARYGENIRWPMVMQKHLSPNWKVIEEGLPGRTTSLPDPEMGDHMNGQVGLKIALDSHGPIDLLVIMLGTNDSKIQFGLEAKQIASGLASLLNIANTPDMQHKHDNFNILIITPPKVKEQNALERIFFNANEKTTVLDKFYSQVAEKYEVNKINAGDFIETSEIDGVHFEPDAHRILGKSVADYILSNWP
jgi:lysophospholipase L1-like esterase